MIDFKEKGLLSKQLLTNLPNSQKSQVEKPVIQSIVGRLAFEKSKETSCDVEGEKEWLEGWMIKCSHIQQTS